MGLKRPFSPGGFPFIIAYSLSAHKREEEKGTAKSIKFPQISIWFLMEAESGGGHKFVCPATMTADDAQRRRARSCPLRKAAPGDSHHPGRRHPPVAFTRASTFLKILFSSAAVAAAFMSAEDTNRLQIRVDDSGTHKLHPPLFQVF